MAAENPAVWMSGHFDPLLAEHARILHAAAQPGRLLIVEVTDPAAPLLGTRARAELVAALADVDYVVVNASQSSAADSPLTEQFVRHVRQRAGGAKA